MHSKSAKTQQDEFCSQDRNHKKIPFFHQILITFVLVNFCELCMMFYCLTKIMEIKRMATVG